MDRLGLFMARLDGLTARWDAAKRRCTTGYSCGSSCISLKKECRSTGGAATSKERIARLEQLARGEIRSRGIGALKPDQAMALAEQLRSRESSGSPSQDPSPMDISQPFSRETMDRLVSGIETRSFAPSAAQHDGTDLALALQKLAEAPGLAGQHARAAMAFMEEVQAVVLIQPQRGFAPVAETKLLLPSWKEEQSIEENIKGLNDYLDERHNAATRIRGFARRTGLWPDEMIQALEADQSPVGKSLASLVRRGRDGLVEPDGQPTAEAKAYQDHRNRLSDAVRQHAEASDPATRAQLETKVRNLYDRVRMRSFMEGADVDYSNAFGALGKTLSREGTGGHYRPGGNVYWKVSGSGVNGSVLDPEKVKPSAMQAAIGNAINIQDRRPAFTMSSTSALNESERSLVTHIHELGHMVHDASSRKVSTSPETGTKEVVFQQSSMQIAPAAIRALQEAGKGPTEYANTNVAEMFAESFAAYVLSPAVFRDRNPELYSWVHSTLGRARKVAVQSKGATRAVLIK